MNNDEGIGFETLYEWNSAINKFLSHCDLIKKGKIKIKQ